MTWTAPTVDRTYPPYVAGEHDMLRGWLEFHRRTLLMKCAGLSAEQLKMRSVEPSSLSLIGLVRHMAEVERWWFRRHGGGEDLTEIYCSEQSPNGDFDDLDGSDPAEDLAVYARECAAADAAMLGRGLDDTHHHPRRGAITMRWIYTHMVEEYARHNGHADLIRERVDGTTGD